jgi:serine protease Do
MNPKCEYPLGVLVADIDINSAAYRAGLSTYDIITEFAGKKVTDRETLSSALAERRAGETVTVKVFRFNRTLSEGEYKTITFKLDAAK